MNNRVLPIVLAVLSSIVPVLAQELPEPRDVNECVQQLKQNLPKAWVEQMEAEPAGARLGKYHQTIGLEIRNNYLYGKSNSPLVRRFFSQGIHQASSMSSIILSALFNDLHKKRTDLDRLVEAYRRAEQVSQPYVSEVRTISKELRNTSLKLTGGKSTSLARLLGKTVVLVDVSTRAAGSKEAFEYLNALFAKFKPSDLQIIGMIESERHEEEMPADYKGKFLEIVKPSFPVVLEPPLNFCSHLVYPGVLTIPQTVLIGKDGKICDIFNGWDKETPGILYEKVANSVKRRN